MVRPCSAEAPLSNVYYLFPWAEVASHQERQVACCELEWKSTSNSDTMPIVAL